MGRFGWRSGYLKAQNVQSGKVDITTDINGDGTAAVTFPKTMKAKPAIVLTAQEADITGTLCAISPTATGFTASVDGSSVTSGTLTVGWVAIDY